MYSATVEAAYEVYQLYVCVLTPQLALWGAVRTASRGSAHHIIINTIPTDQSNQSGSWSVVW